MGIAGKMSLHHIAMSSLTSFILHFCDMALLPHHLYSTFIYIIIVLCSTGRLSLLPIGGYSYNFFFLVDFQPYYPPAWLPGPLIEPSWMKTKMAHDFAFRVGVG